MWTGVWSYSRACMCAHSCMHACLCICAFRLCVFVSVCEHAYSCAPMSMSACTYMFVCVSEGDIYYNIPAQVSD